VKITMQLTLAGDHLGERELHGDLHVGAGTRAGATAAAEHVFQAAECAKVAHENAERFGEVDVVEATTTATQGSDGSTTTVANPAIGATSNSTVTTESAVGEPSATSTTTAPTTSG